MKTFPTLILILLTACTAGRQLDNQQNDWMQCRLEFYCTRAEGSIIKAAAFKAIEIYFGTDLGDGICEKHYQAWGYDYRLPALERCGGDSQKDGGEF